MPGSDAAEDEEEEEKGHSLRGRFRPHLPAKLQRGLDRVKNKLGRGHDDRLLDRQPSPGSAASPGTARSARSPLLVHGKSGIIQTEDMLAEHIADILPGWSDIDRSTIKVENVSAEGGGSVYKVSAEGARPPKVALHVWDPESDDILKERTTAAANVFASAGLGPKRLAHGGDWFVEPWEGSGEPEWSDEKLVEVAELVAKVHRISPEWYEAHRERICERMPALREVPYSSHVWSWTSRDYLLGDLTEECLQAWLGARFLQPTSPLALRLVNSHADCHSGNMLQTDEGVLLIDFEWACVTCAAQDLVFVLQTCCDDELDKKRTFMKAYASSSSSAEVSDDEVDALIFDCEVWYLGTHCGGPLELWEALSDPEDWLQIFRAYEAFVPCARASPELRQVVLEKGIVDYVKELEMLLTPDKPLMLCPPHEDAAHERFLLGADGSVCCEAQHDLVLGVTTGGAIILVRRDDARRLVLQPPGAQPGGHLRLALASHPGHGMCIAAHARQVGPGPGLTTGGLVQPVVLGTAQWAMVATLDGARIGPVLGPPGTPPRVLHAGDPVQELSIRLNRALWSASEEGDVEEMEELVKQGADVNWANNESMGHPAAREGNLDALEFLLARGFDVNKSGKAGGSTLIEAATYAHVAIVRRLLAVPGLRLGTLEDDKTALDWAVDPSPHTEPIEEHGVVAGLLRAAGCPSRAAAVAAAAE